MSAAVEVHDLHKSYGDVHAVRGISFGVDTGEIVAVLGPNGAGKTTTIEMLEGFRAPTSGTVRVLGTDPATGGSPFRARIGVVLQETGIDRYLTVGEVLQMYASYYPSPRSVEETIELVGLDGKRDARVKTLSGGQQRRLDVGLGLVGDPELLFLDEPTTGFDPSARRQAWNVVHRLRDLGKTVLLTTHYMEEAQELADRLVVIAAGRILAEGTPDAIGGRAVSRQHHPVPLALGPRARRAAGARDARRRRRARRDRGGHHDAAVAHRVGRDPGRRPRRAHRESALARGRVPGARRW